MPGIILSKLIQLSLTAEILSPLAEAESQVGYLPPDVYVSSGDPQSSPHAWAVSALTREPPPQAKSLFVCCKRFAFEATGKANRFPPMILPQH